LTAGRRSRDAVHRYCEERVLVLLGGMIFAVLFSSWLGGLLGLLLAMVALLVGILGPGKLLALRAADRQNAISRGLPGAVDLLTTCIDAGLSPEQAIGRVARELRLSAPTLAEEFSLTASEFEAGVSLPDALRRLARRVGLDDLSALCGVVAQAHGLGAPIANTLREYAQSSRRKRMSMLEERAGKLAAQLTIPLALCLLPAALLIIIGPAVVQLIQVFQ
jgi:tight adherence protein C